jgi:hypothetical protein
MRALLCVWRTGQGTSSLENRQDDAVDAQPYACARRTSNEVFPRHHAAMHIRAYYVNVPAYALQGGKGRSSRPGGVPVKTPHVKEGGSRRRLVALLVEALQ